MQIALGKLLLFDFFSQIERACLFALARFIYSWMKSVSYRVWVLYWKKIIKMFIPRICWLYRNCLVNTTLPQVIRSFFYMWEIPWFSWYSKIVWQEVCFSLLCKCKVLQKCRVNVIVARKRELSQKPNLRTEKIPRHFIFISIKAFKRYVAWSLKGCS